MESNSTKHQKVFLAGIILIAIGISFTVVLREEVGSLGTVFFAIGVLLFIRAMSLRWKENEKEDHKGQTQDKLNQES